MRFASLKIENFKGFEDSGVIVFDQGFNVVVGKNNSGKSALLEALKLGSASHSPHRSLKSAAGMPLPPHSTFQASLIVSGKEMLSQCLHHGATWVRISREHSTRGQQILDQLTTAEQIQGEFKFTAQSGAASAISEPSHNLFAYSHLDHSNPLSCQATPTPDFVGLKDNGQRAGAEDDIPARFSGIASRKTYVFDAQRLNVGSCPFGDTSVLLPNASNLPQVLLKLSANPDRFARFNRHVNEVFDNIEHVAVNSSGQNLEIRVWPVSTGTEREDLTCELNQSGTGIGQVLAILYVAMTMSGAVIAVDEPNSFLHPGAIKSLINILREYSTNQYIFSTHSSDVIIASAPERIHIVKWVEGASRVQTVPAGDIDSQRGVLAELGVALSDMFGPDAVVWVEGQTEEHCFPIIARHIFGKAPMGISFVTIRSTSAVEKNNKRAEEAIELYERISGSGTLLPPAVAFAFDRELRSREAVNDLIRRSTKTRVLPRRTYENYLLNSAAIAFVLKQDAGLDVSEEQIESWILRERDEYLPDKSRWWEDDTWIEVVDAPRLLDNLFQDLTGSTLEYRKTRHSPMITTWILENAGEKLDGVRDFVLELLPR